MESEERSEEHMEQITKFSKGIHFFKYITNAQASAPHSKFGLALEPFLPYRGTSLTRKRTPPGPYSRPIPRDLRWSWRRG